ncbi:hypothetical protein XH98_07125, partial [Bradyrhizobium sp. CCBAU 51745]|uniref:hypothetical protein n=1 Tax=Bradyrhizobium sp. CCBAU 51745 TaxID=1325099 RepID=UPI0023069C19
IGKVDDIVSESTGDFISVRLGDFVGIRSGVQASREEKRNQAFASDIKTYAVQSELHLKIKVFSHHP